MGISYYLSQMLSDKEKNRYNRHLKLNNVGLLGQNKLKKASVLVVGAGGLGCPILQYLTAAGVGKIGVVDDDKIEESNLQRQILFNSEDVGKQKAIVAVEKLSKQNPFVQLKYYNERLTTKNALALFSKYDIIVDGTDNFSTRYLINDACILANKPLVFGAIYQFEGQLSVFNYKGGPSYRCLFPEPPKENQTPNCSEVGVLGVLPGVMGTMQANEVLKIILEIGEVLSGKLKVLNLLDNTSYTLQIAKNSEQLERVKSRGLEDNYDLFCGINESKAFKRVTLLEAKTLVGDNDYLFLDVREEWEQPQIKELNALQIPLDEIDELVAEIPKDKKLIVFCQTGGRSKQAILFLEKEFGFNNLYNLEDGVLGW